MIVHPNFIEVEATYRRELIREAQKQNLIKTLRSDDRAVRPSLWQWLRLSTSRRPSTPSHDYIPAAVALEVTRR